MIEQYIKLLRNQIDKLDVKDFDLDSWKESTKLVLERIFGKDSEKIQRIGDIHYDLSSWSLRDTLGTSAHFDTCRKKGRDLLETCIMELETVGLPEDVKQPESHHDPGIFRQALEEELKISQFRELQEILADNNRESRERRVLDFLGKIGSEPSIKILMKILANQGVADRLKS
ncbi:MAG: hypothetical protein JSV24_05195 [Bacteroidales bacterium]|nr:MAG: hypothetical protein JSV24_05195 [Bacteroidales bacterium]